MNENDNANTTATGGSQGGKEPGAACAHIPEEDDANISSTVELPLPGPADDARAATATRKEGEDRGREEIGSAQRARPAVPPANCEDAPGDKPDTAQPEEDNAASALPIPPPAKKEAETDEGKKGDEGDEAGSAEAGSAEPAPPPVIFDDEEIERRKAAIKGNKDLPRVNDAAAVAGGRSKLRIVVWHLAARHLPPHRARFVRPRSLARIRDRRHALVSRPPLGDRPLASVSHSVSFSSAHLWTLPTGRRPAVTSRPRSGADVSHSNLVARRRGCCGSRPILSALSSIRR